MPNGCLYLVVGPSGVGKDTLLARARDRFSGDPGYVFPTRVITRPADAGGEDHDAVSEDTFAQMTARGAFALHWQAHDLHYGIRRDMVDDLLDGKNVVVNVSRGILEEARRRFSHLKIVFVTARPETRAARLVLRDRESLEDQIARLSREAAGVAGDDVVQVDNDGALEDAVAAFISALTENAPRPRTVLPASVR